MVGRIRVNVREMCSLSSPSFKGSSYTRSGTSSTTNAPATRCSCHHAHQNFCRAHACATCFFLLSHTSFLRLTPLLIITCCALKPRHIFLSCNSCFMIIKTSNSPSTLSHLMRIYCEANFVLVKGRERQGSIQHVVRGHAATAGGWCIAPSSDECNASNGQFSTALPKTMVLVRSRSARRCQTEETVAWNFQ